ncbi:MAG: galactitol-1-phosphate 5-dehydrogenase [Cyclobacteriaceae bacterium]|jgi:L-iditol 2-dehydrogenase
MKALVLEEYNKLVYTDMPVPEIKSNEVLIRVKACGICGSDVHGMDGSSGRRIPPIIMGHEASGIIEKTGGDVSQWQPGDRVTFDSTIYPLNDWFTERGMYNLSENRRVLGVSPGEYRQHGAFAEYVAVPEHILYKLPEEVDFVQAAMVEPVAVACHAVELTKLSAQDKVAVVGTGMIGLFLIQVLSNSEAGQVIAVDIDDQKLHLARQFGAHLALNPLKCDVQKEVQKVTENRGADVVFEVVGNTESLNLSIGSVRKGGTITLIGNLAAEVQFPLQSVVTRQIKLQGSCAIAGEYPMVLKMMQKGLIDIEPLLSATAPLSEGASWFKRLYDKEPGLFKVVLIP